MGHFVLSLREREKSNRRDTSIVEEMKERDGEEREQECNEET